MVNQWLQPQRTGPPEFGLCRWHRYQPRLGCLIWLKPLWGAEWTTEAAAKWYLWKPCSTSHRRFAPRAGMREPQIIIWIGFERFLPKATCALTLRCGRPPGEKFND